MNIPFFKNIRRKAFSLIELSIVILIVSILITGALAVSIKKIDSAKVATTNDRINKIYNALKFYLTTNSKLPCPAPITDVKSSVNTYGTAGSCIATTGVYQSGSYLFYGMVPVKDLNLSSDFAEDAFGSKFAYVVDSRFANSSSSAFGTTAIGTGSGLITIKEATTVSASYQTIVDENAIFAIISYGSNKLGAFNANSSTQNAVSSDVDELNNNYSAGFDSTFISSSKRSDVFDDIVFYKTRNSLVLDADAMGLIPCPSETRSFYSTPMVWPSAKYNQIVASTTADACPSGFTAGLKSPTRKCGAFGEWEHIGAINDGNYVLVDPCLTNGSGSGGGGSGGGGGGGSTLSCTGGSQSTSGGNNIHTFSSSSSLVCTGSGTLTYLVVGGGGGGGGVDTDLAGGGGGGGGGGVKTGTYTVSSGATITVTVGSAGTGGTSAASPTSGSSGGTSSIVNGTTIASATGGAGGHFGGGNVGAGGDSGSGDGTAKTGGASGACPGPGGGGNTHGSGGGGASMASNGTRGEYSTSGSDNPVHGGGDGAGGTSNSITGSSVTYGGGGGGGAGGGTSEGDTNVTPFGGGSGGSGGGGSGYWKTHNNAVGGTNGLGGGGGGGGTNSGGNGASGGSGVVIFSYTTPS